MSNSKFQWSGLNRQGKRVDGVISAVDQKEAQNELKKTGIEVISLQPKKSINLFGFGGEKKKKKIKPADILLFTRFLSTMLAAGLPIIQALDIIGDDQGNPAMQSMVKSMRSNIAGGKTLAESFSQYPQQFNELYCSLIKAGEKSGTLDKILIRLAIYMERTETLKRKVKKALIYPSAIMVVALVVSLILLLFVVPQFEAMFKSFGAELPFFTRMILNLSKFLKSYWWLLLLIIGFGGYMLKSTIKKSEKAKLLIDKYILRTILIGAILRKSIIARFTRTLAITMDAGMPIIESMKSMAPVMGNRLYSKAVLEVCDDITSGHQLSVSMASTKLFPNMAIQMISVGEASGSLGDMLNRVADYYEEEVSQTVDNLSSLMEPLIMAVLGVLIGGFVVAMYLPIFKLGSLF